MNTENVDHKICIKTLATLFTVFFRIGAVTFGGGLAMLPILRSEMVDRLKWISDEEMLDYYVIGQSTPGIIATNVATFVGYKKQGFIGSLIASIAIVLPSLIIITIIASMVSHFDEIEIVRSAIRGINIAVAMLLFNAVFSLGSKTIKDIFTAIIGIMAFITMKVFNISAIWIVLFSTIFGILIQTIKQGEQN